MKGSGTIIMVRDMSENQGKSISQISRELGISRNTVKKYLREGPSEDKRVGSKRSSKLDAYKACIRDLLSNGILNATVIFNRLAEQGYTGGISILKEYLKPLRPPRATNEIAVIRYETKPGQQAQMDWGICKYIDPKGRIRKIACFVMVLGYSRMRYIEFRRRCDQRSLLSCIVNAFLYFGGIPLNVLTDHMKTVVIHMENKQAIWQEDFEHFAAELGFVPKLCRVRRPATKGKVERLVHYVKDNFMPGRIFLDDTDLNQQAQKWLDQVNAQVHGTTGERPIDLLPLEQLQALPTDGRHLYYTWETRKVSRDGFMSFDGAKYGVHWRHCGTRLHIKAVDTRILIVDEHGEVIQEHQKARFGRKYVYAEKQYEGLLAAEGHTYEAPYGRQIDYAQVEIRDLSAYEMEMEGR